MRRYHTCYECKHMEYQESSRGRYCKANNGEQITLQRGQHCMRWCPLKKKETSND